MAQCSLWATLTFFRMEAKSNLGVTKTILCTTSWRMLTDRAWLVRHSTHTSLCPLFTRTTPNPHTESEKGVTSRHGMRKNMETRIISFYDKLLQFLCAIFCFLFELRKSRKRAILSQQLLFLCKKSNLHSAYYRIQHISLVLQFTLWAAMLRLSLSTKSVI